MDTLLEIGEKMIIILLVIAVALNIIAYMNYVSQEIKKTNEILINIEEKLGTEKVE